MSCGLGNALIKNPVHLLLYLRPIELIRDQTISPQGLVGAEIFESIHLATSVLHQLIKGLEGLQLSELFCAKTRSSFNLCFRVLDEALFLPCCGLDAVDVFDHCIPNLRFKLSELFGDGSNSANASTKEAANNTSFQHAVTQLDAI